MASYFQTSWLFPEYFKSSSMPKRLLQYVLSKLEILDTDDLDLEKLDIAWGKNSTVEFRDVGLRLRKLETLLQLPPSFELVKARVLLLRLTIPVDVYNSPIIVEVDGVEGQLRVKTKSEKSTKSAPRNNNDRKGRQPRSRSSGNKPSRTSGHSGRRESDFTDDDDVDPALPTAADLAQSFLQTEPENAKAELEAAILSETQELGTASSVMSDDGELPIGTGAPLSLPTFITNFLQGMADRLQVRIHGITLNLELELPNESSRSPTVNPADTVTVQLKVENVDVEGVTQGLKESTIVGENSPKLLYKEGKRLVSLSNIRGALISEANLFSSLARSSGLSSPSAAHSDVSEDRRSAFKPTYSRASTIRTFDGASSDRSSTNSSGGLSTTSIPRNPSDTRSLSGSVVASDGGRFDDASEDGEASHMGDSTRGGLSDMGDSIYQNSAYLDQLTESQYLDEEEKQENGSHSFSYSHNSEASIKHSSPLVTPKASMHFMSALEREANDFGPSLAAEPPAMLQSTILPNRPHSRFSEGRVSISQQLLPADLSSHFSGEGASSELLAENVPHTTAKTSESDEEDGASTPMGQQDLAESQLFSHEDAESMYMSAISHASSTAKVPGGWANSSSDGSDEDVPSLPHSRTLPKTEDDSRDNLQHARKLSPTQTTADLHSMERSSSSVASSLRTSKASSWSPPQKQPSPPVPQLSSGTSELSTTSSDEYSRLSKQVFSIDRVDIYIPGSKPSRVADPEDIARSAFDGRSETSQTTSVNVPGAFSTHLPKKKVSSEDPHVSVEAPATASEKGKPSDDKAVEIQIGQLSTQFDISVGRLMFMLVQQLQEALNQDTPLLLLSATNISVLFLERLEGTLGSAQPASNEGRPDRPQDNDVLLRTTLEGLSVNTVASQSTTKTTVTMKKFVFGYAQESIISFDAGLQMRASVRDLKASDGIDVRVHISTMGDVTRCEVITLPLHVAIDLQRLDETFSWFGGLSSVLNLGSSIASNATVTASSPSKPKPRGVRFETPIKPDDKSLVAQNKADVRIGGLVLDLIGADCSIGVETSAVKIVNRDEGIGVFVQATRLAGPHLKHSNEDPAIIADITSIRVEFLPSPKDADLARLLALITPSKSKYDEDDDILLDTLMRQRRHGSVLRLNFDDFQVRMARLEELSYLPDLGEEVSRLATVAKYLPDDERPGLLSLITVRKFDVHIDVNNTVGTVQLSSRDIEVAQITLPSLIATSINTISVHRNASEELVGATTDPELQQPSTRSPAIMARMIGDEMEPVVKIKLWNVKIEYRVPTLLTLLGLVDNASPQDMSASLAASVATLTNFARPKATQVAHPQASSSPTSKPMTVDIVMRDCSLALNPLGLPSKLLIVLSEAHLNAALPKNQNTSASLELSKASLLIVDNVAHLDSGDLSTRPQRHSFDGGSNQVADLCAMGYVSVSYISSAKVEVKVTAGEEAERSIDVELRDDLFVLETCADSSQTLIAILNALTPPSVPSKETKYRTKVIPVHDLLASLSGDAFGTAEGDYNFDDDFGLNEGSDAEVFEGDGPEDLDFDSHFYQQDGDEEYDEAILEDEGGLSASTQLSTRDTRDGVLLESFIEPEADEEVGELDFHENHFGTGSVLEGTAHRWNSTKNTYDRSNASKVRKSPLKVSVRDVHIIWNLFDGYDWQSTRDTITKAVQDVESQAIERRARNDRRSTFDQDIDDEDTVIGDFLFNSIYIGVPGNRDPRELAAAINQELNDTATETESIATTYISSSPSRQGSSRKPKSKKLRLNRSKHHKITFELRGVSVDLVTFPPGTGETQSSVDVRVNDIEIFDHVPTSTWRKFATYMQDAGERESGTSMIHLEILNVKPIPDLAASEIVLKATVLPLRLHVDQDALDFITRFFEFKEDSTALSHSAPGDVPFIQRAEINTVQVKLDFKPKRVDYAGLRSGHTTEFMNFVILDGADMELRHTIIYGVSGFDKLGKCLNDIWMPEIKRNQLPGILAGLAPVRSIVNVGGGFKHLITVPIKEYKKDGRVVRGISKGASAFAKTTGTELVKLGAKVAIGVQTALQGAEGFLGPTSEGPMPVVEDDDSEDKKQISLYANQPVGVFQGLRGGYAGLQRDLVIARDAIIAVPGEVMESGNAAGVLRAVRKHAPTVILRPAIGVAKAGGQILMGATNSLDPVNLQRADAKYKKH
ncbi:Autophagy-related protein [Lachnellula occidentalis]|uniref:Autophagy-related protein 2 n=1 Tax=Lachnellula occidentalis TaxID=215460 RepID=A0A8H8S9L7_9HELO|nr:Autophagy-related protein [Lachnellula occidentalis]